MHSNQSSSRAGPAGASRRICAILMGCAILTSASGIAAPASTQPSTQPSAQPVTRIPVPNAGFEMGMAQWIDRWDNKMSEVVPDAARSGKLGLRVIDRSDELGSSVASRWMPAVPGRTYRVGFWARQVEPGAIWVYIQFAGEEGDQPFDSQARNNSGEVIVQPDAKEWKRYEAETVAPEDAKRVRIWIHSYSKQQSVTDFDDLEFGWRR